MATIEIRHTLDCDIDTFWDEVFFDKEFNAQLYHEGLGFSSWQLVEQKKEESGAVERHVRAEPPSNAPPAIKKLVGGSLSYDERGTFDPAKKTYRFKVVTSKLSDKVKTSGEIWLEPRGDSQCDRLVRMDVEVKIFGVGKMVEGFVEKSTRDSYEKAARFTNEWLKRREA